MADKFSVEKRSEIMRRVRSTNTTPEKIVRSALHKMGFRYRLYDYSLPGKPDLVFPKYSAVLFVHGCFWHQHKGCRDGRIPKSRVEYWEPKLKRNAERDRLSKAALRKIGWRVLVVWECEIHKNQSKTVRKLAAQLTNPMT